MNLIKKEKIVPAVESNAVASSSFRDVSIKVGNEEKNFSPWMIGLSLHHLLHGEFKASPAQGSPSTTPLNRQHQSIIADVFNCGSPRENTTTIDLNFSSKIQALLKAIALLKCGRTINRNPWDKPVYGRGGQWSRKLGGSWKIQFPVVEPKHLHDIPLQNTMPGENFATAEARFARKQEAHPDFCCVKAKLAMWDELPDEFMPLHSLQPIVDPTKAEFFLEVVGRGSPLSPLGERVRVRGV